MTNKFKSRYVLAEGYPGSEGDASLTYAICMYKKPKNNAAWHSIKMKLPTELYSEDIPKYRLVLERVE